MKSFQRCAPAMLLLAVLSGCRTGDTASQCPNCPPVEKIESAAREKALDIRLGKDSDALATEWLAPDRRHAPLSDFDFTDQDGNRLHFSDFKGSPLTVSFIYTRCQNERKCPLVARTMAELQQALATNFVHSTPKLILITYDPEFDTPMILKDFAANHNFRCTTNAMMLQPRPEIKESLFQTLQINVNFNAKGVNLHGIQLLLFDKEGRYVRTYHSLIWKNTDVLKDLLSLADE